MWFVIVLRRIDQARTYVALKNAIMKPLQSVSQSAQFLASAILRVKGMRLCRIASLSAAAGVLFTTTVLADAIDGQWCEAARQITIDGPTITLLSGSRHQGSYTRYTFDLTVPESEELMHFRRTPKGASEAGPIERWRRCANVS